MFTRFQKIPIKRFAKRLQSSTAQSSNTKVRALGYARSIATFHWTMAGGMLLTFGFVELAKRTPKDDPTKWKYMHYHKSFGLLMGALLLGRIGRRFIFVDRIGDIPGKLPGPVIMHRLGELSHYTMYGFMIFMPVTGILMGYFGGKGVPFFATKIPGASEENKQPNIAKNAYKYHKVVGKVFEIAVGIHISAALFHHAQAHKPFSRMNPFISNSAGISAFFFESIEDGYVVDKNDTGSNNNSNKSDSAKLLDGNNNTNVTNVKPNRNVNIMLNEHWTKDLSVNNVKKENKELINKNHELNESHLSIVFGTDIRAGNQKK